jgi:hypothetical protein
VLQGGRLRRQHKLLASRGLDKLAVLYVDLEATVFCFGRCLGGKLLSH